ncbi:MAG: FIST N-terminal domain-containing protein [Myxococcota bacterium]
MSTFAGVGFSRAILSADAGRDAAAAALDKLGGRRPALALVFATARYEPAPMLAAIRETLGSEICLVGCSGEGVIAGARSDESDRAVAVMAVAADRAAFQSFAVEGYGEDPRGAGRRLASALLEAGIDDARGLLVFADGLVGNCGQLLQELHAALPAVPVIGGTSGDAMEFVRTYQFAGAEVLSGGVTALLIRGDVELRLAVSHGCTPIGLPRKVTRAEAGWVYELDGRPAWSVFKEYLEGDPQDLNADGIVHLCIGEELPEEEGGYVIHTPLKLDAARGALFFPGGGLSTGQEVVLTRRDPDRIVEGATRCGALLTKDAERPALVLQFDCAGRGRVLFGSCAADYIIRPIQERLGPETPWIGFHTYGEIAPTQPGTQPRYHNYTVALCALYDRSGP